ncbi:three component ABC system middle component [Sphingomonas pseudosanguinis]|uniref:Uncharacterized protein n=1 Tax=Sphingomonas pseudosanguinis TaxID=413712 RepID=A0A7W6F1K1_9SPHN|nr:three component ABC system middle component [Sphingomonas pseudosanguinis]MBB3877801.1 hypothetical protein [Sphingomonas pseudosanguinis]MBN3537676.1 hypothetical protein [Sphingomonas pseudosanguinis]
MEAARERWNLPWSARPREEAALFNPAFCLECISRSVIDYDKVRAAPLPLALVFLIVPLALHPGIRDVLPRKANTAFGSWAMVHQHILVHVPRRVMALRPVVREALMFGMSVDAIALQNGGIVTGDRPVRLSAKLKASTDEAEEIRRTAALLGRWFGAQAGTASVLQGFGVRP